MIHTPRLERTLERLAATLKPGGKLVLVDDILRDGAVDDRHLEMLKKHWRLTALPSDGALEAGLARNKLRVLHDEDPAAEVVDGHRELAVQVAGEILAMLPNA